MSLAIMEDTVTILQCARRTYETFKGPVAFPRVSFFAPFRLSVPESVFGVGGGRFAANSADWLRSIYFEYSFSANGPEA